MNFSQIRLLDDPLAAFVFKPKIPPIFSPARKKISNKRP
jgi:hypothetical protein